MRQQPDNYPIWHPFTPQYKNSDNLIITRAEGVYLYDEKGNGYIDAISSWWVNLHGHAHPYIAQKINEQAKQMEHCIFSGFTHPPAIELAQRLLEHLPKNQAKVFYSDNGSTAVEVALKMTLQYWHNQQKNKSVFIALKNAYHGDTFGSMSVGARNVFNNAFEKHLFDVVHIPIPSRENVHEIIQSIKKLASFNQIAGFIYEPLIQGAAGMMMYDTEALDILLNFCRENEVITIADEVMTGFGRTGKFFAGDYLENKPDIICLSKGLTGGFMPLGVTSCNQKIHSAFLTPDKTKTFFHGHSYTANPLACSAALASLDLMEKEETNNNISRISEKHRLFTEEIRKHPACEHARSLGVVFALNLKSKEQSHYLNPAAENAPEFFFKKGIIIRPLGNVLYILPPYCITNKELDLIYEAFKEYLSSFA